MKQTKDTNREAGRLVRHRCLRKIASRLANFTTSGSSAKDRSPLIE
jgi:hypothetical protein